MQTDARSQEGYNLTASDPVEGRPVRSRDGSTIGTIELVIIDKVSGKVDHAVLRFNGSVAMAQRHLLIRWSHLSLKRNLARCPISRTSSGVTAAMKSSATMMIGRRPIGES